MLFLKCLYFIAVSLLPANQMELGSAAVETCFSLSTWVLKIVTINKQLKQVPPWRGVMCLASSVLKPWYLLVFFNSEHFLSVVL